MFLFLLPQGYDSFLVTWSIGNINEKLFCKNEVKALTKLIHFSTIEIINNNQNCTERKNKVEQREDEYITQLKKSEAKKSFNLLLNLCEINLVLETEFWSVCKF